MRVNCVLSSPSNPLLFGDISVQDDLTIQSKINTSLCSVLLHISFHQEPSSQRHTGSWGKICPFRFPTGLRMFTCNIPPGFPSILLSANIYIYTVIIGASWSLSPLFALFGRFSKFRYYLIILVSFFTLKKPYWAILKGVLALNFI